jgi:TubC N-terminal docking domain
MEPATLLSDLTRRGCRLRAEGGRLLVTPLSPGSLTDADRAALRAHKPALLALLSAPAPAPCGCVVWPDGCIWGRQDCPEHGYSPWGDGLLGRLRREGDDGD